MGPYYDGLLQAIKNALAPKKPCAEAFACMAMLARFYNSPPAIAQIQSILRIKCRYLTL